MYRGLGCIINRQIIAELDKKQTACYAKANSLPTLTLTHNL